MAVTFPNSPNTNDVYPAENGINYLFDGEKWKTLGSYNADTGSYFLLDGTNTGIFPDSAGDGTLVIKYEDQIVPSSVENRHSLAIVNSPAGAGTAPALLLANTVLVPTDDTELGRLEFGGGENGSARAGIYLMLI